jgi:hypothetical protein
VGRSYGEISRHLAYCGHSGRAQETTRWHYPCGKEAFGGSDEKALGRKEESVLESRRVIERLKMYEGARGLPLVCIAGFSADCAAGAVVELENLALRH